MAESTVHGVDEEDVVDDWRFEVLRQADIDYDPAIKLAKTREDLHRIVRTKLAGCDDKMLLRIFT